MPSLTVFILSRCRFADLTTSNRSPDNLIYGLETLPDSGLRFPAVSPSPGLYIHLSVSRLFLLHTKCWLLRAVVNTQWYTQLPVPGGIKCLLPLHPRETPLCHQDSLRPARTWVSQCICSRPCLGTFVCLFLLLSVISVRLWISELEVNN